MTEAKISIPNELRLDNRVSLPDALRILLEEYPREGWEKNNRFDGLVRFWLERHVMFRRLLDILKTETRDVLENGMEMAHYTPRLAQYGGMFVNQLHTHHHIEDFHYFPVLERMDARLVRGFGILDSDHHDLEAHLVGFAAAANAILAGEPESSQTDPVNRFHDVLEQTSRFLHRHLTDEEELVVPVILKYGTDTLG